MKRAFLLSLFASVPLCLCGQSLDRQKLADAIYRAEGGPRAKVPYGILAVKVRNEREARAICLRTIDHAWRDFSSSSPSSSFIEFLAARYCPPSADPTGHRNWKRNVTFFYERQ